MNYYDALLRAGKVLDARLEQSRDVNHAASKGAIREDIVKNTIRPFLPFCYGLSGGEAFDSLGNISKQLDLVVYDAMYSYVVPYIENYIQFPCESIYGNIEIKTMLNKEEFNHALDNIASLKKLKRNRTHSWQVTPQVCISVNGKPNDYGRNPYFGIIFAYDSVEVDTVLKYINELNYESCYLPNAIILYSKRTVIIQTNDSQIEPFPTDDFDRYSVIDCGNEIMAVFIGLIINYTRYSLLATADVSQQVIDSLRRLVISDGKKKNGTREVILKSINSNDHN